MQRAHHGGVAPDRHSAVQRKAVMAPSATGLDLAKGGESPSDKKILFETLAPAPRRPRATSFLEALRACSSDRICDTKPSGPLTCLAGSGDNARRVSHAQLVRATGGDA